jgi:hypothetical protein
VIPVALSQQVADFQNLDVRFGYVQRRPWQDIGATDWRDNRLGTPE